MWNLKNAPFAIIHRGNTVPHPLTFLELKFRRALLMVIQVRHCLVFALAMLLSVRGMTVFSEHWNSTGYPDDTQWSKCLRTEDVPSTVHLQFWGHQLERCNLSPHGPALAFLQLCSPCGVSSVVPGCDTRDHLLLWVWLKSIRYRAKCKCPAAWDGHIQTSSLPCTLAHGQVCGVMCPSQKQLHFVPIIDAVVQGGRICTSDGAGAVGGLIAWAAGCPASGNKPWANSWLKTSGGLDASGSIWFAKARLLSALQTQQLLLSLITSI